MQVIDCPVTPLNSFDGASCIVREPDSLGFMMPSYKETKRNVEGAVVFAPALWQWD